MKTHLLLLGVLCLLMASCTRNHRDVSPPETLAKLEAEKEIGKFVAKAFKDKAAKKVILANALKQWTGDFSMMATTLIEAPELSTIARSVNSNRLQSAVSKLTLLNRGNGPTVFYPRAETVQHRFRRARGLKTEYNAPEMMSTSISNRSVYAGISGLGAQFTANNGEPEEEEPEDPIDPVCDCVLPYDPTDEAEPGFAIDPALYGTDGYPVPTLEPIIVLGSTYDTVTGLAEGFILDEPTNTLVPVGDVAEEYAWEHDVLVVGSEDVADAPEEFPIEDFGGYISNSYPSTYIAPPSGRSEMEPEKGGIIQIPDLGKVEGWPAGKIELMVSIISSNGTTIKENHKFPKVKRKFFRDSKWYDYELFLVNWDSPNLGKFMYEKWVEIDGATGSTPKETTVTFPPACSTCVAVTQKITTKADDNDEQLGGALIAFADNKSQVYNINYGINIKRK